TYGGSPVACAAAIETIKIIRQPRFLAEVSRKGRLIRETLEEWQEKYELIGNVRGLGAMMLLELVLDRHTKEPAPQETLQVIREAVSRGLLLIRAGLYSNCVRLLPPLVITDDQLREALAVLEQSILAVQTRNLPEVIRA